MSATRPPTSFPATARAVLNIRFNDRHSGASLTAWLRAVLAQHAERFDLDVSVSGESFLTPPGPAVDAAARRRCARRPAIEPAARHRRRHLGCALHRAATARWPSSAWSARTMHQVDECVPVAELRDLAGIYRAVLAAFLP